MLLITLGKTISFAASVYMLVLLARVAFDWARLLAPRWTPKGPLLLLADWVYKLTDPPIRWMRRYIPPLRLGAVALDVGFLVVFILVSLVGRLGQYLAYLGYTGP